MVLRVQAGPTDTGAALGPWSSPLSAAGDVFAMRPLLLHASRAPQPGCPLHRRILHLEFAPSPQLPAGFGWRDFLAASESDGTRS